MKSTILITGLFLLAATVFILSGCATQSTEVITSKIPGFFMGIVHGFILIFSFIGSLFTDYRIYAFPNSGAWYDFGYLLGVLFFFGGGSKGICR